MLFKLWKQQMKRCFRALALLNKGVILAHLNQSPAGLLWTVIKGNELSLFLMKKRISSILNGYHNLQIPWEQDVILAFHGNSQSVGFVTAIFTHLNLFISSLQQRKGCAAPNLKKFSHLRWFFIKWSACCWKGKRGGMKLSGCSGRRCKSMTPITTKSSWSWTADESFCKKLGNFHHVRFRENYIPASIFPVKAKSENDLGFHWARGSWLQNSTELTY